MSLVEVTGVSVAFPIGWRRRPLVAVRNVDLSIERGETVGLIGESGSGKTTLGRAIAGLVPRSSGTVMIDGQPVHARPTRREVARQVQVVFQDPYSSTNPRLTVGRQLAEVLRAHEGRAGATPARVRELLDLVHLDRSFASRYPAELSGGQLQRVGIARALAPMPKVLVLDEPTSALDLTVRGAILNLLGELQRETGISFLLISHDINSVRRLANRTLVMYLGTIVEFGPTTTVLHSPRHPYTQVLLSAELSIEPKRRRVRQPDLGEPPSPINRPKGCAFAPRCPVVVNDCTQAEPELVEAVGETDVMVRCVRDPVQLTFPARAKDGTTTSRGATGVHVLRRRSRSRGSYPGDGTAGVQAGGQAPI